MSSSLGLALAGARDLVAASAAFQTRRGVGSAATALPFIRYYEEIADFLQPGTTLAEQRPFAIVGIDRHGFTQISQGLQVNLGATGGIMVLLSDNPHSPEDHSASFFDFADWVGTVMEEIAANCGKSYSAGTANYWPFNSIELVVDPYRPPMTETKSDDFWVASFALGHSINSGGG
jgi:hypothetical protein